MTAEPIDYAHRYAKRGWRVVPIIAGTKRPALTKWTELATTETDTITEWWGGEHAACGVGIATGPESGVWVLDVDDLDSLADLQHRYEQLPDTLTSLTGSGGTHLVFKWPTDGRDIRNDAGRRLGPGLDIRGTGGQIVAPPTIHPSGVPYAFDAGMPSEPVNAPEWLLELVTMTEPTMTDREVREVVSRTDRPGDQWAAATSWESLLGHDGWTLHHQASDGECFWTRPGKDARDGASATTGYAGSGGLKVFTSSLQDIGLMPEESYSKLGYLAAVKFGGDHSAAASFLAGQGWGETGTEGITEKELTVWLKGMSSQAVETKLDATLEAMPESHANDGMECWDWIDLAPIWEGDYAPPRPSMLERSDGVALLYLGRVHSLAGEPGGGKTWVALHAILEAVRSGGTGLMIDYEDNPASFVARLQALGATVAEAERIVYVRPTGPLGAVDRHRLLSLGVSLAVIDSVGESLAVEGESPNDDDAVARWMRLLPRMLAQGGAAVLLLDHVTKDRESRGLWAIGSQRKLAAIDGAAYGLEVRVAPTREATGYMSILCAKDRHGTHQRGRVVAQVEVSSGEGVTVALTAPELNPMPEQVMTRISEWLKTHSPASTRVIRDSVTGKASTIKLALEHLERLGHVANRGDGQGFAWHFVSEFDPIGELMRNLKNGIGEVSERQEQPVDNQPVPRFPPVPEVVREPVSGRGGSPVPRVNGSRGTGIRSDVLEAPKNDGGGSHDNLGDWGQFFAD